MQRWIQTYIEEPKGGPESGFPHDSSRKPLTDGRNAKSKKQPYQKQRDWGGGGQGGKKLCEGDVLSESMKGKGTERSNRVVGSIIDSCWGFPVKLNQKGG